MTVVDLQNVRQATLARVRAAIAQNEKTLAGMSLGHPQRYLVRSLLKILRRNEAMLAAGLVPRRARLK